MPEEAPITILIVGDQLARMRSYAAMLGELDARIVMATSTRRVLTHLLKHDVAIVLMDLGGLAFDGVKLAELIRAHPRSRQSAIIFVTTQPLTDVDALNALELQDVDYLCEPIVPAILRSKVALFIELFQKTQQLDSLRCDLEQRVAERTAALQSALRMRDEFLSRAAHELKTPITSLKAATQLILRRLQREEDGNDSWLADRLRVIDHQSVRLTRMIEQLLNATRFDQKRLIIAPAPNDVVALTEKVIDQARLRTAQHQIVLNAESFLIANVDPEWMELVIANLVDNAIKYTSGGRIDIELTRLPNLRFCLAVRDYGNGVAIEKRSALFQRYYEVAGEHHSGLGLGLFLCRQIIEAHSGEIDAEFPADGGSRFVVTMPLQAQMPDPVSMA